MRTDTKARIGISLRAPLADLSDLEERLADVAALGVDTTELRLYEMDLIAAGRVRGDALRRLVGACRASGLGVTLHAPKAINLFEDDASTRERHRAVLAASLEIAARIDALRVVVHAGRCAAGTQARIERGYARQRALLDEAGEIAREAGTILCVETMIGGSAGAVHTPPPGRLARELAAVGHPHVAATLDVGHVFQQASLYGLDFLREVAAIAPLARHLHVHDTFGLPDDVPVQTPSEKLAFGQGDLHLPVGEGAVPWDALADACCFPADIVVNIELKARYWDRAPACVAATRAFADRLGAAMRREAPTRGALAAG